LQNCRCRLPAVEIMSRERALDDIVTEFLLNTCRLRQRTAEHRVLAAMRCGQLALVAKSLVDAEAEAIPIVTGSLSEFYIEPMLPHIGDMDLMLHFNNWLAIPRGHPPPTQLPAEFHNCVTVFYQR